jgi:Cu(I)/Ag(I) efflux system membrane fusion protein
MPIETLKTPEHRAGRPRLRVLAAWLLGITLGAGAVYAHMSGLLAGLYHALGLHELAGHPAAHGGAQPAVGGHAGHGGMAMPQAAGEPSKLPGYSVVAISAERQQLIGVRTGKVARDRLLMSIRAVGIIEPDQTRLARLHLRVNGWVTKVHVNFVGQEVKQNERLLELYSPDLLATQLEYLLALESWEAQGKPAGQRRLVDTARRRLELWGVPADELRELDRTRKARETLSLRSPIKGRVLKRNVQEGSYVEPATELYRIADLSVVWLQAKVYEYELPHVEVGQPVQVSLVSQPGTKIRGKVSFIEPVFQETTRTVKVRVAIDNPGGELRPGMYADLLIEHGMGKGLLVPESAVLRSGERNLAFRVLPGHRFEPVNVTLGGRFQERYQVLAGLKEGDTIVTSAGFLIDAESRLRSATAAMSGHQHGSGKPSPQSGQPPAAKGHEHRH